MSQAETAPAVWREPGVADYASLCLSALGAIWLVLVQSGFGVWSLLPVAAGLLGGLTRFGPLALPLVLGLELNYPPHPYGWNRRTVVDIPDLVLCGAVLAYAAGHYRLQSLVWNIFPPDLRRPKRLPTLVPLAHAPVVRRSPRLVLRKEVGALVLSLPVWAALAQVSRRLLPRVWANPGFGPEVWQAALLAWLIGLGVLAAAGMISQWYRRQMTVEESLVLLQDTLWTETRREQRRINRWRAWAGLRRHRERGEA
jgi:hypothetical protein